MTVKHATSSVFVFGLLPGGWRLGLIQHPRFGILTIPGGHVEEGETDSQAALRELTEETGLVGRLVEAPGAPVPAGCRATLVARPWWIAEYQAPSDGRLATDHVHVDHLYVAVADDPAPGGDPAHPFGWHAADGLAGLRMFDDTRTLAAAMLTGLNERLPRAAGGTGRADVASALVAGLAG